MATGSGLFLRRGENAAQDVDLFPAQPGAREQTPHLFHQAPGRTGIEEIEIGERGLQMRIETLDVGQRRGIELDITGNEVVAAVGQMVARGVGMLSYRSPVGLEEKFGREWFKEPGPLLRDRGVFSVESWLRMHGRRITTRSP